VAASFDGTMLGNSRRMSLRTPAVCSPFLLDSVILGSVLMALSVFATIHLVTYPASAYNEHVYLARRFGALTNSVAKFNSAMPRGMPTGVGSSQHCPSSSFLLRSTSYPSRKTYGARRNNYIPNGGYSPLAVYSTAASGTGTTGTTALTNPLIEMKSVPSAFPPFDRILADTVVDGIKDILKDCDDRLEDLEKNVKPTWEGLVEPLEKLSDPLERTWGAVQHLKMVKDTDALREAVESIQPEVVQMGLKIKQNKAIDFKLLKDSKEYSGYSEARKRIVEAQILSQKLSGGELQGEDQAEFNRIQQRLAELSTNFGNNVLDATKSFSLLKTTKEEVKGLPESALALAAQNARDKGHEEATAENGPWVFLLDIPVYMAVQTYAEDRDFRKTMYDAFITRASEFDDSKGDNSDVILEILRLRQKKAELLGYKHHADVSLATKMADLDSALGLLEELRGVSLEAAQKEHKELEEFAKAEGCTHNLERWDVGYYAEKMRQKLYDLDEEKLRVYFSLPNVLEGLITLIERLFDVKVEEASFKPPVWDESVMFYQVTDKVSGKPKAYFYLDPYSRPAEKRGGAWMNTVVGRSSLFAPEGEDVRLPVAHMVLNQAPPVDGKPSLMKFREVETLFHEMGHALQHMLTTQTEGMVAGIENVEWDAVEQPSQFMENWLYDEPTLMGMAQHYETKEKLPHAEFEKIKAARTFRAGSVMARQIHFAMTDLLLHSEFDESKETPYELDRRVAAMTEALPPVENDRFLNAFSHIFAGGYSAGYYSYKWAEVLSADCFAAFEEVGLDNEEKVQETGIRFRDTVLAMGGGKAPMEVFKAFRGREPSTEALLRHSGLLATSP